MSALPFLVPDVSADSADAVRARTPMERRARSAGASFELRDGWNVAVAYGPAELERARIRETVGFADRSASVKLEINADPAALAPLGLTLGSATLRGATWWCPVTPSRVLVVGEASAASAASAVRAEAAALGGTVIDMTCGLAAMALLGPGCRELLARFCAIDVRPAVAPVRSFRPGSIARTPGYLLVEAEDRLLIMIGWALGEYLWEVVADAAEHLGGGPVGATVLAEAALPLSDAAAAGTERVEVADA